MSESWLLYGSGFLSLVAVAQFWIWLLMRRAKGSHKLELYESGTVEIGFDANGPLIGIAGVLRASDQEIFVQSMELTLTNNRDKTQRTFRWMAFKPNFLLPLAGVKAWEMPHPFMVMPGEPGKFNVVFHDVEAFPQVKGILQQYCHQWHEVERKIHERRSLKPAMIELTEHDDLISEFKRQEICVNSYTELNRKCFWDQGNYSLTLKVITEGGKADVTGSFGFNLGKQESKLLKTNCVIMLDEPISGLLGKPPIQCQAVQAEYTKPGLANRT
jgi:hypothetical protein